MRYPQVVVYEADGLLAGMLRKTAQDQKWSLREPRQPESCLRMLRRIGPSVVVLRIGAIPGRTPVPVTSETGKSSEREQVRILALLERIHWLFPDTATVVVGESEDRALAGLAWDLGASYALFPPQLRYHVADIVISLMNEAIRRQQAPMSRMPAKPALPGENKQS